MMDIEPGVGPIQDCFHEDGDNGDLIQWKACKELGCFFAVDEGCLLVAVCMLDGTIEVNHWADGTSEVNICQVSELPYSEKPIVQALFPNQQIFKVGCVQFY